MRDPARIDVLIELLRQAWQQNPDLRLGQLIVNSLEYGRCAAFHTEDDIAQELLRAMVDGGTPGLLSAQHAVVARTVRP